MKRLQSPSPRRLPQPRRPAHRAEAAMNGEHVLVDIQARDLPCWSHRRGGKPGHQPGTAGHVQNALTRPGGSESDQPRCPRSYEIPDRVTLTELYGVCGELETRLPAHEGARAGNLVVIHVARRNMP